MWRWHCTKEWTEWRYNKNFLFLQKFQVFFCRFRVFLVGWLVCVCVHECGRLMQIARQLYGCSSIIQMCFIRPIKTVLQFQLAHLHEPIFITSKAKTFYHLSTLLLHSCVRVVCLCIVFHSSTIFGVGALAFITLRFSLSFSAPSLT